MLTRWADLWWLKKFLTTSISTLKANPSCQRWSAPSSTACTPLQRSIISHGTTSSMRPLFVFSFAKIDRACQIQWVLNSWHLTLVARCTFYNRFSKSMASWLKWHMFEEMLLYWAKQPMTFNESPTSPEHWIRSCMSRSDLLRQDKEHVLQLFLLVPKIQRALQPCQTAARLHLLHLRPSKRNNCRNNKPLSKVYNKRDLCLPKYRLAATVAMLSVPRHRLTCSLRFQWTRFTIPLLHWTIKVRQTVPVSPPRPRLLLNPRCLQSLIERRQSVSWPGLEQIKMN